MTKKKKATAALAAVLAVALVAGAGSFAYLSAYSDPETNEFSINKDSITLEETTGNDYEIIPGTYDQKDPILYVDTDVDAYVYALVWGNNPFVDETTGERALVYEYDEGWTELELDWDNLDAYEKQQILNCFGIESESALGIDSSQGGFVTILYREVGADEVGTDYSILRGDLVKYNENITNEMMEAWKEYDIFLSFAGYIIESEPFANAEAALYEELVNSAESMYESIEKHGGAVLTADISVDVEQLDEAIKAYTGGAENAGNDTTSIFIELNENTLTLTGNATVTGGNNNSISGAIIVPEGYILNIIGEGTLIDSIVPSGSDAHDYDSIAVEDGGELIMTDVTATLNGSIALEAGDSNGVIRLNGCDITVQNRYGVRGHADSEVSSCTSEIYLVNCTITATGTYDESHNTSNEQGTCGVLMNFPGKLEIIDCGTVTDKSDAVWTVEGGISGTYQGVVIRAGETYISNSVISQTAGTSSTNLTKYDATDWSSGNKVACGAVVIGTNVSSYTSSVYDTDCSVVIEGDTVLETYSSFTPAIYAAAGAPGKTTSVTVEGNTVSHGLYMNGEDFAGIKVGWIVQNDSTEVVVNGHSLTAGYAHAGVTSGTPGASNDNFVYLADIEAGAYDAG